MTTLEKIKNIVAEYCDIQPEKINDNANFVDDLGLDSLDSIELVMKVEEEFGVEVDDESMSHVKTVEQLADAIDKRKKKD